jgi:hypothetical protein
VCGIGNFFESPGIPTRLSGYCLKEPEPCRKPKPAIAASCCSNARTARRTSIRFA